MAKLEEMHRCPNATCGYIYDPQRGDKKGGVAKNVKFEELSDRWCCPLCGAGKQHFKPLKQD